MSHSLLHEVFYPLQNQEHDQQVTLGNGEGLTLEFHECLTHFFEVPIHYSLWCNLIMNILTNKLSKLLIFF